MSSHTNATKRISDLVKATLENAIPDVTATAVFQFPTDDESASHVGRFGRSVLIRAQDFQAGEIDTERKFRFELRIYVKDAKIEPGAITDFVEQVRYHLHTVRQTTVWVNLTVVSVEYAEQAVENVKQGRMFLEVIYSG